ANGQERDLRRETAADLAETGEISGVAGVIDGVAVGGEYEPAVSAMRILDDARAPVAGGHMRYGEVVVAEILPPVHFDDAAEAEVGNEVGHVLRNDDRRRSAARA